jgi:hypothetical protein
MSQDTLASLANIDPALLTEVVRQDQRSPNFELRDWTVAPLSHYKMIETTGGLYRFSGKGADERGEYPWSVVLKIVTNPGDDTQAQRDATYWRRELLAYQSGLLSNLPGPVVAPRCYGVREYQGGAWIWLEHVVETAPRRWTPAEYYLAARQLGAFASTYLSGTPLPQAPWLTDGVFRSILAADGFFATSLDPTQLGNAWESSLLQHWYAEPRRSQILALWADIEQFFAAFDRPPQVFCHLDAHRRNLLIRTRNNGVPETVAIDWSFAGRGPLGADAGSLVMDSLFYFELEPTAVEELAATVLDGYRAGLRDGGWRGDPALLQLGYAAQVTLWYGATLPAWTAYLLGEEKREETVREYGRSADEIAAGWVTLWEYAHERAAEARSLIHKLARA